MAELHALSYAQCEALLRAGVVGRIAVCGSDGPYVLPVNYALVGPAIILRTAPDSLLAQHASGSRVAFQIDYFDYTYHRGCSVMARGTTDVVDDPTELAHIRSVWEPTPWAAGERSLVLRIRWTELSGRQLGSGWDPMSLLPVRRTI